LKAKTPKKWRTHKKETIEKEWEFYTTATDDSEKPYGERRKSKDKKQNPREEEVERTRCPHSSLFLLPLLFGALLCTRRCAAAGVVSFFFPCCSEHCCALGGVPPQG